MIGRAFVRSRAEKSSSVFPLVKVEDATKQGGNHAPTRKLVGFGCCGPELAIWEAWDLPGSMSPPDARQRGAGFGGVFQSIAGSRYLRISCFSAARAEMPFAARSGMRRFLRHDGPLSTHEQRAARHGALRFNPSRADRMPGLVFRGNRSVTVAALIGAARISKRFPDTLANF
jgi:hypothetical protein